MGSFNAPYMKTASNELISIYINLLKTTMGCGILNYPSLVLEFGIVPCIILTFISALSSYAGIFLYIELNDKYGRNNTLSTITQHFKPVLKIFADIIVIFKCYTVAIAYLVYMKSQIEFLLKYYKINIDIHLALLGVVILIAPFVFMNKLDKLKYTSSLGLLAILLLISTSLYRYLNLDKTPTLVVFGKSTRYIENLSYFVFSFTCHQNIFTVQNEMKSYNPRNLKITSLLSFLSASLVYLAFGIISYMAFGDKIVKPFVDTHPQDKIKVALTWFYILLLGLSVQLQTNPAKQYFLNMIDERYVKRKEFGFIRAATSFLIIGSCYLLACTSIDFDKMCKFIGGTFSTCMCFLFAGLYYFMSMKAVGSKFNTFLALVSTIYGILAFYSVLKN